MNVTYGVIYFFDHEFADPREIEEEVIFKADLEQFVKKLPPNEKQGVYSLLEDWFEEEELINITGLRREDIYFPSEDAKWQRRKRGREALKEFYRSYRS
jgi:hypothetical protein